MPQKAYTLEELQQMGAKPRSFTLEELHAMGAKPVVEAPPAQAPAKPESWMDLRFPGMMTPNEVIGGFKGAGKAVGDFVQTGGQWMENIFGMPVSPPRTTSTGRDVFQPNSTAEKIGKALGQTGLAVGGGMAAGPSLPAQVLSGGLMGALQNPDAPGVPAAAGMAAPVAASAISKAIPLAKALLSGKEAGAAKFGQIAAKVKGELINTDRLAQPLINADLLKRTGQTPPEAVKALMNWQGPIDYEAGRKFASSIGRLTPAEKLTTKPEMRAVATQIYDALKTSNREVAAKAGMGEVYDEAMRLYRMGAKGVSMKEALVEALKNRGVQAAIGTGIGGYIAGKMLLSK